MFFSLWALYTGGWRQVFTESRLCSCDFPVLFSHNLKNKSVLFLRASGVEEDFTRRRISVEKQTFRRGQICFLFYSLSWSSDSTKWTELAGAAVLPHGHLDVVQDCLKVDGTRTRKFICGQSLAWACLLLPAMGFIIQNRQPGAIS